MPQKSGRAALMQRAIGFLLIVKALSPFIWLFVGYLVVSAIVDRFDQVSLRYSAELNVQLEVYDELAERIGKQIEAVRPTIEAAIDEATREVDTLVAFVAGTIAQLKNLPPIDLSNVMPELKFPAIALPKINLNWNVPNVPIVREVVNGIKTAVQAVANSVNSVFSTLTTKIRQAFEAALAPLRNQLVANVLQQLRPYIDAYARVSATLALVGTLYDRIAAKVATIEGLFAEAAQAWRAIGDELGEQIGLSVSLVETVPENLGWALGETVSLLVFFALFTLALFLVFYWASMLRDLLQGWALMTGRYDEYKRRKAEPREPALDRWMERLEQRKSQEAPG